MKILELRFKNLNSLYGEWVIDFTAPEYVSNGIFALTGSTGSGKSTILDAICLALYGTTPRLGRITQSANEIMSRQTGECYAEVLFASRAGRFRCHWEQRRARRKVDGNLLKQEHQIVDADTGKPIETMISRVSAVIEEKTGMDFDRFTRSVLLAQGGFDTFLRAEVEQKSKILEQITGTAVYSEISRQVHERQRDESEKLNILEAEISGIPVLAPEQEKEIQQELAAKQKQEKELAGKYNETSQAIVWLHAIKTLQKEIQNLAEEAAKLEDRVQAFQPEKIRLDKALAAVSMDGIYATLTALGKQQSEDQVQLDKGESALPDLEAVVDTKIRLLRDAEQATRKTIENFKAQAPQIRQIRFLDQKIAEKANAVVHSSDACRKDEDKIALAREARQKELAKRSQAEKSLKTVTQYLAEHARDEWLISGLAGIEEQLATLAGCRQEMVQKQKELKNADAAVTETCKKQDAAGKESLACRQTLEIAEKNLQQGQEKLHKLLDGKLLREYRAQKDHLLMERVYLQRINELEEHRARLEDGKACPLCGAIDHPFARGNIPRPDEIDVKIDSLTRLINGAEEQEAENEKWKQAESDARKNLNEAEKREVKADHDQKAAATACEQLKKDLAGCTEEFEKNRLGISEKLKPLGITEISGSQISSLLGSLRSRLKLWQEKLAQNRQIETEMSAIDSEIKRLDTVVETQCSTLQEKQENLESLKKEHAQRTQERQKLYGSKNPDEEEQRLNQLILAAQENETKARNMNIHWQKELATAKARIQSLKNQLARRLPELEKAREDFFSALSSMGFADEQEFCSARLTSEEREILSSRARELDSAGMNLAARQKDRQDRLAVESGKNLTDKTLDELELRHEKEEESLTMLRDEIAAFKHRLNENTAARDRIKEKQAGIDAQKKECARFAKLHALIGSADGKKYRNFAQGLTFELMVSHANRQLKKMTDRYLLIRDDHHPLELNVVDNYQAGEIRSTKNLSGGESFIVSLTLALGLSKMASRKVRIDSLFLDEGFGTLDEDALDTALETLSGLQQDGKLIGIISHVPAIKERISTRISVIPDWGGRSFLSGPGCSRVAVS